MSSDWFFRRLKEWGDAPALVHGDTVASYAEILSLCERFEAQLVREGVNEGTVVALEGSFSPATCALLLVLLRLGAVAVPLSVEMLAHRRTYLETAEAQLLLEVNGADQVGVTRTERGAPENPLFGKLRSRCAPGLVIFTSGTSGVPKAVLHDFARILGKFEKPRQRKTTLSFLMFDHIGGIDTLLGTLGSGGKVVTVPARDPASVALAIERHRVHTLPASPTFLNLLMMSGLAQERDLSSLQVIAYGTEPMPEVTLQRLREAFPNVALVQTYGMSELGVIRSRSRENGSLWLEFTGEGHQIKVVDGTLWVKAESAMLGYLNAPDLFDAEGFLNTQDAVLQDGAYLRVLGRASEMINVGGQKVHPSEIENHLLQMEGVSDATVFGKSHPMMGQMVAARVALSRPEELADFKVRMHGFLRERLAAFQVPRFVEFSRGSETGARFKKVRHGE